MLFGVPDEITEVTRVSGMVQKRRLIYRMTSFDYRKVFGVTGNVPGMTNGFREFTGGGATHSGEAHRHLEGSHQPLVGWWDSPKGAYAPRIKNQRKRKKKREEVGREGDSLPPNLVQLGLGGESPPPWLGRLLEGPWTPRQGSPSSPYIYGGFRADLRRLFHGSPTTYLHGFSSRSRFCGARAEPC